MDEKGHFHLFPKLRPQPELCVKIGINNILEAPSLPRLLLLQLDDDPLHNLLQLMALNRLEQVVKYLQIQRFARIFKIV